MLSRLYPERARWYVHRLMLWSDVWRSWRIRPRRILSQSTAPRSIGSNGDCRKKIQKSQKGLRNWKGNGIGIPKGPILWNFFKKILANPGLFFVYLRPFLVPISTIEMEKIIDGVLGIWTWGPSMVSADKTTELWRLPYFETFFHC